MSSDTEWQDWNCLNDSNNFVPVRVDKSGTTAQCMSFDVTDCAWQAEESCVSSSKTPPKNISQILCTPEALADPNHWCYKAVKQFGGGSGVTNKSSKFPVIPVVIGVLVVIVLLFVLYRLNR
jgi:hypothetical protein